MLWAWWLGGFGYLLTSSKRRDEAGTLRFMNTCSSRYKKCAKLPGVSRLRASCMQRSSALATSDQTKSCWFPVPVCACSSHLRCLACQSCCKKKQRRKKILLHHTRLSPVTWMIFRLVRPTQSANSITLGTVADSSTRLMCGGSMMMTCRFQNTTHVGGEQKHKKLSVRATEPSYCHLLRSHL